jgi:protein-tyrosine phosphatase
VIEILVVCTGNVCRSPYAQLVLTERLRGLDVVVSSAGVRARTGATMTPEAVDLAVAAGVPEEAAAAHAAVWLTESHLRTPDVVIGMSREHRRAVVELAPSRLRSSFTARELARLAAAVGDDGLRAAAAAAGSVPARRVEAMLARLATARGEVEPPVDLTEDDVIDPIGRSRATYERAAAEMGPGIDAIDLLVRLALEA